MVNELIKVAGISLNMALEAAANEPQPTNRVFSVQIDHQRYFRPDGAKPEQEHVARGRRFEEVLRRLRF